MIDLGGNWCADCRIMSGLMELPEMHSFLAAHYEIATVDVGAPQLAMHSARELMGANDVPAYTAALRAFLSPG